MNSSMFGWLLDLIYPPKCPFCGRVLERYEDGMCLRCQPILPWTEGQNEAVDFCEAAFSPLWYRDGVRDAVHRFKFLRGRTHGDLFGKLMAQCLRDRWNEPVDLVVWVPLSPKKKRKRGYDQVELLARRVGAELEIPVADALEKIRETATQSSVGRDASRRANVLGAYEVRKGVSLAGKRILLVDDVVTSGATLSECASCLLMEGAECVTALTFARAR